MSELFKHLGHGQQPSAHEYNRLVDAVMGLLHSSGVQYFSDSTGVHARRMPVDITAPIRAFVKLTPGATTSVDVYLGEDNSDTEVTVSCYIYGGGNLEDAYPTLVYGMPFYVQYDKITKEWKNVTSLYKIAGTCNES